MHVRPHDVQKPLFV